MQHLDEDLRQRVRREPSALEARWLHGCQQRRRLNIHNEGHGYLTGYLPIGPMTFMNEIAAGPIVTIQIDGKNTDYEWKHHLRAGFRRGFFRALPAFGSQRVGEHAKRIRDARAELVGLHQHGHERAEVVDTGPIGEIAQCLGAPLAGEQLQVDESQLGRQDLDTRRPAPDRHARAPDRDQGPPQR